MNNTIKIPENGHTVFIAHRGLSGLEPENTNAAFVAAGNRSYYGIESDVHKTVDGKYVMMHDANTLRQSGDNIEIATATYETLRSVRLKQKDGSRGRTDLRIPSLEEYISICKYYGKKAVLELKDDFTEEDIDNICKIVEAEEYMDGSIFISFKMNNLLLLRQRNPEQPAQFLTDKPIDDALIRQLADEKLGLDAYHRVLSLEILEKCRVLGIETNAWTVNDPEIGQKLMDWGIDYITTNILE